MMDYTRFLPYFEELDRICEEKNLDDRTIEVLKQWFAYILNFYKPSNDILEHRSVEEYIKHNFEKLKQTEDIKVFDLKKFLINPNCLLYKCINRVSFNIDNLPIIRFSKSGKNFIEDNKHGEYYNMNYSI